MTTQELQRKQRDQTQLFWGLLCLLLCWGAVLLLLHGCAGRYNAAKTHQTVTMVVADAGTVAIQAEQAYQAGKIPQTETARKAINDLGAAYNTAKEAYSELLMAEAAYNGSQLQQINACAPSAGRVVSANTATGQVSDSCKSASDGVAAAKTKLDTQAAKFNSTLDSLATKTAAVKSLQAKP